MTENINSPSAVIKLVPIPKQSAIAKNPNVSSFTANVLLMADFAMIRVPVFVAAINSNLLALWRMQNQKFCLETLWLSSKMKLVSRHNDDAIAGNQVV